MLSELPPEVLSLIFECLVRCIGIRSSVRLRIVCRAFNIYILDCIYSLPAFEDVDDKSPAHLSWDAKMDKAFVAGLIRSKMKRHGEERQLTREILRTERFILSTRELQGVEDYRDALARLAANSLPLHQIIRGLSRNQTFRHTGSQPLENALVAAAFLGRTPDIKVLLSLGAKVQFQNRWFGDALIVAGCYSQAQDFFLIVRTTLATSNVWKRRHAASRLMVALHCAAAHGRDDIFCEALWDAMHEMFAYYPEQMFFECAIKSATVASNDGVVLAIFTLLRDQRCDLFTAFNNGFWIEVLRLASSRSSESTARLIIDGTALLDCHGGFNLPLEDACRAGSRTIVELLLAYGTDRNLYSYAGAIYWAARRGHYDTLSLLFRKSAEDERSNLENALCGASVHGPSGISAVLDLAAGCIPTQKFVMLNPGTFLQVIEAQLQATAIMGAEDAACTPDGQPAGLTSQSTVVPSAEPFEPDLFRSLMTPEQLELTHACSEGDMLAVYRAATQFQEKDLADWPSLAGGFSESIRNQHPCVLHYLCEKFPSHKYFSVDAISDVRSVAILQILVDHGWNVDSSSSRLQPPVLGTMLKSEELACWFLDQGADPNARCDWDTTPLSSAIINAPLSTVSLLLRHGGDSRKGQLLHFAVERTSLDQLAIIDFLIASGASIDARMFEDDPASWMENQAFGMGTPLHKAVSLGNRDVVEYLVENGADCTLLDSAGRTVFEVAAVQHYDDMANIIKNHTIQRMSVLHGTDSSTSTNTKAPR